MGWSISASPLIMGNDLRNVSAQSKQILQNKDAISVSQDALGKMGIRHPKFTSSSATQVWFRELHNGDVAVALYNSGDSAANITLTLADVGFAGKAHVYDIWTHADLGDFEGSFSASHVAGHGTAFYRLS